MYQLTLAGVVGFIPTVPQILHGLQEADNIPQIRVHIVEAGSRSPCEDRIEGMEYESQYDAQYDDMRAEIQEVEQTLSLLGESLDFSSLPLHIAFQSNLMALSHPLLGLNAILCSAMCCL